VAFALKGWKKKPRYFNLPHYKVVNFNINRTALTFFFDPVYAMYATAYLFLDSAAAMCFYLFRLTLENSGRFIKCCGEI
jgi:hypothetical protein